MTVSPSLPTRPIGHTGLYVTELGFGAASLGIATPARLQQTLDGYRHPIPSGFWRDLIAQELIRPDSLSDVTLAKEPLS